MFIVRKQFRANIIEETYGSESQAIAVAYKSYERGGWQHIMVINTELDETIVEFGDSIESAMQKAWRTLHAES